MRNLLFALIVLMPTFAVAQTPSKSEDVPQYLQEISVTIRAGEKAQGSGVLFVKGEKTYVLTASHVVADLRTTRKVIRDGSEKPVVEFEDPTIVKVFISEGRTVGRTEMIAKIIKYSDAEHGQDLCILQLYAKNFAKTSAVLHDGDIPHLGTNLIHCGSLMGEVGSASLTKGILSQWGRLLDKKIYDQCAVACYPGSSGGGMYLENNGTLVGVVLRGAGENFTLIRPAREIRKWAKDAKVEWVFNSTMGIPSDDELKQITIED